MGLALKGRGLKWAGPLGPNFISSQCLASPGTMGLKGQKHIEIVKILKNK